MPQLTIWRMRLACWTTKATNTHSSYSFSTATIVERTRLTVTLSVHWQSCSYTVELICDHWLILYKPPQRWLVTFMINTISASWLIYINIAGYYFNGWGEWSRKSKCKLRSLKFNVVKFLDIFSLWLHSIRFLVHNFYSWLRLFPLKREEGQLYLLWGRILLFKIETQACCFTGKIT